MESARSRSETVGSPWLVVDMGRMMKDRMAIVAR